MKCTLAVHYTGANLSEEGIYVISIENGDNSPLSCKI